MGNLDDGRRRVFVKEINSCYPGSINEDSTRYGD